MAFDLEVMLQKSPKIGHENQNISFGWRLHTVSHIDDPLFILSIACYIDLLISRMSLFSGNVWTP